MRMTNLAQNINIPGYGTVTGPLPANTPLTNIGTFLSGLMEIVSMIVAFLAFFWLVWGAFHYIFAGGDKEQLGKARARIIWAIVGLLLTAIAFALAQFVEQILKPRNPSPISLFVQPAYAVDLGQVYDFGDITSLGKGVSLLVTPAFSIATTAVVIYLIVGGIRFLTSGGNKESVAKAQAMITHSIIGFIILIFVFLILQFIPQFFGVNISLF